MFDETGERTDAGGAAVYALTAGGYWCMLAESNGEAALFDAPEGNGISRFTEHEERHFKDDRPSSICALCISSTR